MSRTTAEAKAADNTVRSSVCSSIYMTLINLGCHQRAAEEGFYSFIYLFLLLLFVYILQNISGYNVCVSVYTQNWQYIRWLFIYNTLFYVNVSYVSYLFCIFELF